METEKKTVRVLWTGGWDSTYRVIELSRMDVIIQPIYVSGDARPSEELELAAMRKIQKMLTERKETIAEFRDILIIDKATIPPNEKITDAFRQIHKVTHLGTQHEWLARYAYQHPGLEIGTEKGVPETSHIVHSIQTFGHLVQRDGTYMLDKDTSTEQGNLVLGNFTFPIIDKYETDMLENVKRLGYEDVMKEIWFCHRPIHGKPCGLCHPCAVKMESDMAFLLPEKAQKRYKFHHTLTKVIGEKGAKWICDRLYR